MKKTLIACGLAIGVLATATTAVAQYTGPTAVAPAAANATTTASPAAGAYTGPSSVPVMTAKQMIDNGKDDQHARLQGRIVSHDGGKNYTFADDTGKLTVEISAKLFPPGQPVSAEQRVELVGEIDKDWKKMEFEVDQVRLLP